MSRELLEHVKQQLADSEAERKVLLSHIMSVPAHPAVVGISEAGPSEAKLATPFDTTLANFRKAPDKARFRARL